MNDDRGQFSKLCYTGGALTLITSSLLYANYVSSCDRLKTLQSAKEHNSIADAISAGDGKFVIVQGSATSTVPLFAEFTKDLHGNNLPVLYRKSERTKLWKDRGSEKELWVNHETLESCNENTANIKLSDSTGVIYPTVTLENLQPTLTYDDTYRPPSLEVQNVMSDNLKVAGYRIKEWTVPAGIPLTCIGTVRNRSGSLESLCRCHFIRNFFTTLFNFNIKCVGTWKMEKADKPYFLTTRSPTEIYVGLSTEANVCWWGSMFSLLLGVGLFGAGYVSKKR
eukprot:TRINITY_DN4833_c0_g2_i7.p1 TRINITY_DN4833_c0_g2~~TRINITY_DN4833_c0_g2_i7.p1  ORF type:complete len:281 (-),score=45.50 TRINITY_DN4833_c0_g2_i7:211-1053(-)